MDEINFPGAWLDAFDGEHLDMKLDDAALVATTDPEGWPHVSFLGAGEILAAAGGRLILTLWSGSSAAANLRETKRASFFARADGMIIEARLSLEREETGRTGQAIFLAAATALRPHHAPYAEVTTLVGFRLLDPPDTVERWREQVTRMRMVR